MPAFRFFVHLGLILSFTMMPYGQNTGRSLWNAADFGAKGDGVHHDGTPIQQALNEAAKAGGGTVQLPAGQFYLEESLTIPSGVTLQGVWNQPHHSDKSWGTVLLAKLNRGREDGPALIQMQSSSTLQGVTIYYPEQRIEDIQPYPWAIQSQEGHHVSMTDITLVNAYQGIDVGTHGGTLHFIRNVFGCVLRRGIYVDGCYDIGRIENVHFNPHYWGFLQTPEVKATPDFGDKLIDYLNIHLEAFIFGRTDWEYVLNTFAFAFHKCYVFIKTERGACNGNFLGIGADEGQYAVWIEATQRYGLLITNGEFVTFAKECPTQVVTTKAFDGVAQFSNCSFWGPTMQNARIEGKGSVTFQQCNFDDWGKKENDIYSLAIEGGSAAISNCRFALSKPHISIGPDVTAAVVMGNQFGGKAVIDNQSKGPVEIGLNIAVPSRK